MVSFTVSEPPPVQISVPGSPLSSFSIGNPQGVSFSVSQTGIQSISGMAVIMEPQQIWPSKPPGYIRLTSIASGNVSLTARTSTGQLGVGWWDGTTTLIGTGVSGTFFPVSKPSGTSAESPKSVYIWPRGRADGVITGLSFQLILATAIDVSMATGLQFLTCSNNRISHVNLSGCPSLSVLGLSINLIQEIRLKESPLITDLYCDSNLLSSLDLRSNLLIKNLNCSNNRLTSIRATGLSISGQAGANIRNNLLSAAALNQFYSDLAPVESGAIYVGGNPGGGEDSKSIATSKGYTVVD